MESAHLKRKRVAIVGGGVAGSLAALTLATFPEIGPIAIFDRNSAFGRGLAYSTRDTRHRINVPAYKMGGIGADDTEGFADWLKATGQSDWPDYSASFVPRRVYGDYMLAQLSALTDAGRATLHHDGIVDIRRGNDCYELITKAGQHIEADLVFLCLGNPSPSPFPGIAPSARSITDVWAPGALDPIGRDDRVLVIGTGATAVDVVIDLVHRGMRPPITMISRRGLLPLIDAPAQIDPTPLETWPVRTTRAIFAALLQDVRSKAAQGVPWQTVVDTFRLQIGGLWTDATEVEQKRFSRHLRSIWLVHRHRLAPDVAELLDRLQRDGRLDVIAGRLLNADATATGYDLAVHKRNGDRLQASVNWILNCTGPEERYDRIDNPLVMSLLASGHARPGHNGLGFDVDDVCQLRDRNGHSQAGLHAIGHATRGAFWEVTAASNIRRQMLRVAETLRAKLAC